MRNVSGKKFKNFDYSICSDLDLSDADIEIEKCKTWNKKSRKIAGSYDPEEVTLMTYIRHSIHHPENTRNSKFNDGELKQSIDLMIALIQSEWFKLLSEQEPDEQNHADSWIGIYYPDINTMLKKSRI